MTALMYAAEKGHIEITKLLIETGADVIAIVCNCYHMIVYCININCSFCCFCQYIGCM